MDMENLQFGDDIHGHFEGTKIIFHNINGIKDETNRNQIMTTMTELQINIFGFVEINQTLNHGKKFKWTEITRKYFYYNRSSHSESSIPMTSYKSGGTMTTVTGKWQSRITEMGQDQRGLGWWNYIKISSSKKSIIIITAYRPCVTQGPSTTWMQQWMILREEGIQNPDPVHTFYKDIESILTKWKAEGHEIILMIDANEVIGQTPGGLTSVIGKIGMTDLIRYRHQTEESINTYARGTKQMDYLYGTDLIRQHCTGAGILPFGTGYHSDHKAIFTVIDFETFFNTKITPSDTITARNLVQATPKERKIFLESVDNHFQNQNIFECLKRLISILQSEWSENHREEYEKSDHQMIIGMLQAEKRTKKTKTVSWSPKFAKAVSQKAFWKIALSLKMIHKQPSEKFMSWATDLGFSNINTLDVQTIKRELRTAQKLLREIEQQADSLCAEHL
jgi:hypothetical protein